MTSMSSSFANSGDISEVLSVTILIFIGNIPTFKIKYTYLILVQKQYYEEKADYPKIISSITIYYTNLLNSHDIHFGTFNYSYSLHRGSMQLWNKNAPYLAFLVDLIPFL